MCTLTAQVCAATHSPQLLAKFVETLKTSAFVDEQGNVC